MKSTVVDESLSSFKTNVLFQRIPSFYKVNHVFPCFNIMWKNNGCLLRSFLALNLSPRGITTELGKFISFPFRVMPMFLQSISKTFQIQFLLNLTFSIVSLPLILNKWMLPAILHNFRGTYVVVV